MVEGDLRVRLLGDLQVEGIDTGQLGRRQGRRLLKVLALDHGHAVGAERLVDCLWGEEAPSRSVEQVAVLVSRLRRVLGAERISHNDAGYALEIDWLDLDALGDLAGEAERRLHAGAVAAARTAASAGLALVRGPLLADEPDAPWAAPDRARAERLVARLHHTAAAAGLAAGDGAGAAELAEQALVDDPYDEAALRLLMNAFTVSGRPASALAAYARVRERLAEDLGVSPTAETEALHTAVLLGESPSEPRGPGTAGDPWPEELPGRVEALSSLNALLERALGGDGQVAMVEGEAGMGKSALMTVWSRHAARQGAELVSVACDELGRALALQSLLDAVGALIRAQGGGPHGVEEVLGSDTAVLAPMLGVHADGASVAELALLTDPGAGSALLFGALFGVLRRRAERHPLVLAIDDVHLAGPETVAWLAQAVRRLADARVLVVATRRAEEAESPAAVPGATTITLGPLDLESAARVVGTERARELHARSGGHPLFLSELAAAEAEGELPASIRQAVDERCSRAGTAAATLRTAAVMGPEIDLDALAAVTAVAPAVLLDHLEEGVRRRFLVERGETFAFGHALVREALAAAPSASRITFIHRRTAAALRARPDADPLAVSHHARLGGDAVVASAALVSAARAAVVRFQQEEAGRLLDEAVSLDDSLDARLERARVRSMLARHDEVEEDIEAARARGSGPEAAEIAAWAAHFQRRFGRARELADQGALQATDADLRTSCLALGGWVSLAAGDLAGAASRLPAAVGGAPEASGRLAEAWLAWLRLNQGRPDDALTVVRAERASGLAAYRFPNAYALMATTMALGMLGRVDEALVALQQLADDVERMGARRWVPRRLNLRSWIVRNLGEEGEATELNQAAIEAARPVGMAEPLANALLDLAAGRLLNGDPEAARPLLDEAAVLSETDHAFRWRHQLRGRLLRARLDIASGEAEAARAAAGQLASETRDLGAVRYEVQARLVEAVAAADGGEPTDLDEVDRLLVRLDEVAGIESWWITAEVARAFAVSRWEDLARRRVSRLSDRSGAYAGALERAAARRLG